MGGWLLSVVYEYSIVGIWVVFKCLFFPNNVYVGLKDGVKGNLSITKSNIFLEQNDTPCKHDPA